MLYLRLLVILFVSLFTSRITLQALGFNDYGLYNVVGGFVTLFLIISVSISGSLSRYLTMN